MLSTVCGHNLNISNYCKTFVVFVVIIHNSTFTDRPASVMNSMKSTIEVLL